MTDHSARVRQPVVAMSPKHQTRQHMKLRSIKRLRQRVHMGLTGGDS